MPEQLYSFDVFFSAFVYDGTGCQDRKFPLLREVFEAFPKIPINIDIKVDDDELIEKVCISICTCKCEDYPHTKNKTPMPLGRK